MCSNTIRPTRTKCVLLTPWNFASFKIYFLLLLTEEKPRKVSRLFRKTFHSEMFTIDTFRYCHAKEKNIFHSWRTFNDFSRFELQKKKEKENCFSLQKWIKHENRLKVQALHILQLAVPFINYSMFLSLDIHNFRRKTSGGRR